MNRDDLLNNPYPVSGDGVVSTSRNVLDSAFFAILADPVPAELVMRCLEGAKRLPAARIAPQTVSARAASPLVVLAASVVALFAISLAIAPRDHAAQGNHAGPFAENAAPNKTTDNENSLTEQTFGAIAVNGGGSGPGAHAAGAVRSRYVAVSPLATRFVTTGAALSVPLGFKGSAEGGSQLHVWDWKEGINSRPLSTTSDSSLALSASGEWIITGDGRLIAASDGQSRELLGFPAATQRVIPSPIADVVALRVGKAGQASAKAIVGRFSTIDATFTPLFEINGVWPAMESLAFSARGDLLYAMGADKLVRAYDATTGELRIECNAGHSNSPRDMVTDLDGEWLATSGPKGECFIYDAKKGTRLHSLPLESIKELGPDSEAESLVFSRDGTLLATGTYGAIAIWRTTTGEFVRAFKGLPGKPVQMRFEGESLFALFDFVAIDDELGQTALVYPSIATFKIDD